MNTPWMKWFALLGLLLFLGVAVAPSINANNGNQLLPPIKQYSEQLDYHSKNSLFSIDQNKKINQIFDSVYEQMNNASSIDNIELIFKNTLQNLQTLGLNNHDITEHLLKQFNKIKTLSQIIRLNNNESNILCITIGTHYSAISIRPIFMFMLIRMYDIIQNTTGNIKDFFEELYSWLSYFSILLSNNPISIVKDIYFKPRKGNIYTYGLNGILSWDGTITGTLGTVGIDNLGIMKFTGIFKTTLEEPMIFRIDFIGFALKVGIKEV